jgi:FdhD protein
MLVPRRETAKAKVLRFRDGSDSPREVDDALASEEPMEIRVTFRPRGDGHSPASTSHVSGQGRSRAETRSVAVTMRTPGDDFELAAGFLFTEGLITSRREVARITYCSGDEPQEYNLVEVRLRPGAGFDPQLLNRNFYMTSSCGICGKASLEAVETLGCVAFPPLDEGPALTVRPEVVRSLPDRLREAQPVFSRTGGIHAAGLFDVDGKLLAVREDVGRHNAVDKLVGHEFLEGRTPLSQRILAVSGRASFEILQKALMAGIPFIVAVGAPSSLAVDFARRFRMTLAGFARGKGFNLYSGSERVIQSTESVPT